MADDFEPALDLDSLGEEPGLPALTCVAGRFLGEAAAVCLDDQGHQSGVVLSVRGWRDLSYEVSWPEVTDQMRRTFNDLVEATEHGAYAIAILVLCDQTGCTVIERSRRGTGFDYWLGHEAELLFQNAIRLEVSGILRGTESQIRSRMNIKSEQTHRSDHTELPAYIAVVEFSRPCIEIAVR